MATKDWKGGKEQSMLGHHYFAFGKGNLGYGNTSDVTVNPESAHRTSGKWVVRISTPKEAKTRTFYNESQALKFAKSYMRTH